MNGIEFLMSNSTCSLLVYRKETDFCVSASILQPDCNFLLAPCLCWGRRGCLGGGGRKGLEAAEREVKLPLCRWFRLSLSCWAKVRRPLREPGSTAD